MQRMAIKADVLKDIVMAASLLVDEAVFRVTKDGVSARMVDPASVAMVSFEISSKAFESYDATDGIIGVSLDRLSDILGMAVKDDVVELCLDGETRRLVVRMVDDVLGLLSYTMPLLDPSSIRREPNVPNLELPARVVLSGAELRRAVKAAEKVSDHMALGVVDKTFYMEAEGDLGKARLEVPESGLLSIQSSGNARSVFSLDYLDDLVRVLGKAERVIIDLGTDKPARFSIEINVNGVVVGSVSYLLAPRIESE